MPKLSFREFRYSTRVATAGCSRRKRLRGALLHQSYEACHSVYLAESDSGPALFFASFFIMPPQTSRERGKANWQSEQNLSLTGSTRLNGGKDWKQKFRSQGSLDKEAHPPCNNERVILDRRGVPFYGSIPVRGSPSKEAPRIARFSHYPRSSERKSVEWLKQLLPAQNASSYCLLPASNNGRCARWHSGGGSWLFAGKFQRLPRNIPIAHFRTDKSGQIRIKSLVREQDT